MGYATVITGFCGSINQGGRATHEQHAQFMSDDGSTLEDTTQDEW